MLLINKYHPSGICLPVEYLSKNHVKNSFSLFVSCLYSVTRTKQKKSIFFFFFWKRFLGSGFHFVNSLCHLVVCAKTKKKVYSLVKRLNVMITPLYQFTCINYILLIHIHTTHPSIHLIFAEKDCSFFFFFYWLQTMFAKYFSDDWVHAIHLMTIFSWYSSFNVGAECDKCVISEMEKPKMGKQYKTNKTKKIEKKNNTENLYIFGHFQLKPKTNKQTNNSISSHLVQYPLKRLFLISILISFGRNCLVIVLYCDYVLPFFKPMPKSEMEK